MLSHIVAIRRNVRTMLLGGVCLMSALTAAAAPAVPDWAPWAPEAWPQVTVRWEDPGQHDVFVVEGAHYQCRVATQPARVLSLRVDGKDLLGPSGLVPTFVDEKGSTYSPAPAGVTPVWMTWQGQSYKPASSSRARMNVWSASPYYWDAHLLDIPLMRPEDVRKLQEAPTAPALAKWSFDSDIKGWEALQSCTVTHGAGGTLQVDMNGADPFLQSPPLNIKGPVVVVIRMRCQSSGGAAFYWYEDNEPGYSGQRVQTFGTVGDQQWHTYRVRIGNGGVIRRLRFDPPGESGRAEVDWLRLESPKAQADLPRPARGEIVFHAFPDQLRIEFKVQPADGAPAAKTALLVATGLHGDVESEQGRCLVMAPDRSAALLGMAGSSLDQATGTLKSPMVGTPARTCWILQPLAKGQNPRDALVNDLQPLPATAFEVTRGYAEGYDPFSGLYVLRANLNLAAFGFEAAYKDPSRRAVTQVHLTNDARARHLTLKCMTGVGNLEATVVADPYGFPLPIPSFVCKNFGGEHEEPDDTAFGDSYTPLFLAAGERRDFELINLCQDWGDHPLKQVSSIRFFHIYWHLSTGASETTCFTQDWMQTGSRIYDIPDFRPMSGEMWPTQPQHGVGQFPGWLQYDDAAVKLVYEKTTFESVSPCLARFTMHYHTSDNAATGTVSVMEIPQRDELRTFLKFRYDWHQPVTVKGDARLSFRWLNMNQRHGADLVMWTDAAGKLQSAPSGGDKPQLLGVPLAKDSAVLAAHDTGEGEDYSSLVLVRSFRARLGGKDYDAPCGSAVMKRDGGDYWFTVPVAKLKLQPGDFVEAQVMLMPHGAPMPPEVKPQRERKRFGEGEPDVKVVVGKKLAAFPAEVQAVDGVAQFTLTGGFDLMPLVISGFHGWGVPLLWRDGVWQDQQVHGGDGYQVERDPDGTYRFIFDYPTRDDQEQNLLVTRAECTTGIASVHDLNGMVALKSPGDGEFHLKAPCLFAPGMNTVTAASPVSEFRGTAQEVRQVPISAALATGTARVEILEYGPRTYRLKVDGGPLKLSISELHFGGRYRATINGAKRDVTAAGGTVVLDIPAGKSEVALDEL